MQDTPRRKEMIDGTIKESVQDTSVELTIAEEVWSRPIERLGLSIRTLNCLKRSHLNSLNRSRIRSFGDLVSLGYEGLLSVRNFGEKALIEVETLLAKDGLVIGDICGPTVTTETTNDSEEGLEDTSASSEGILVPETLWIRWLDSFGMTPRTVACLRRAGLECVGDLISLSEYELSRIRNFGSKSMGEIKDVLFDLGLETRDQGSPFPRMNDSNLELGEESLVRARREREEQCDPPKPLTIPLRTLIEIPEIGVNGTLQLLGSLEQTGLKVMDPHTKYPSLPLPLLPRAISDDPILLSRLNHFLDEPYDILWESYDSEKRDSMAEEIVQALEQLRRDPESVRRFFETKIRAPLTAFESFSVTKENLSMIVNGRVMHVSGGDPADAWYYIEYLLGERQTTVVKKRWLDGETLEVVAQPLNITRERVRQIEAKGKKTLRLRVSSLKKQGLIERVRWVEDQLVSGVDRHGGYAEIAALEAHLGWPERSCLTWFALNAAVGIFNPARSRTKGKFGRLWSDGINVSSIGGDSSDPEDESLLESIEEIIGPMGIMRLEDFMATFDRRHGGERSENSDPKERGKAFESAGLLDYLESNYLDVLRAGSWVSAGLPQIGREIARAILYGTDPDEEPDAFEPSGPNRLRRGLRSDLIAYWLSGNSDHQSSVRALDVYCERYPLVFAKTGDNSWGLLGAGAEASDSSANEPSTRALVAFAVKELMQNGTPVSKARVIDRLSAYRSSAWINLHIDRGLEDGYLENVASRPPYYDLRLAKELPYHEQIQSYLEAVMPRGAKGQTRELVFEALEGKQQGLPENDILRYVRRSYPSASAVSIFIYLRYTYVDLIEETPAGNYRLKSKRTSSEATNPESLSTIDTLTRVLTEAVEPLLEDEIIARCEQIRPVNHAAIRGYLRQNYDSRFVHDGQGKFSIA